MQVSFFPELIGPETLCWTPSYKDQLSVSQIYLKLDSGINMGPHHPSGACQKCRISSPHPRTIETESEV